MPFEAIGLSDIDQRTPGTCSADAPAMRCAKRRALHRMNSLVTFAPREGLHQGESKP